jgi:tRNA nucleotidyltransferase/poly(A) polymerase
MSDYMFMLESHLTADQSRVAAEVQQKASEAELNLFLAGGAMRDMLGGFPIRDLDFTVEGNALKLAKTLAAKSGAEILSINEHRRSAELKFPPGVTVEIAMARTERYGKPGARPQVSPATIQEDLRGRDFTINAIALSLNRASRGLLLDPTNGQADLERKELRAVHNYAFYDDPLRLLRLLRFKVRLGFAIEERTQLQYQNAREAEMETRIAVEGLNEELHHFADEPDPGELIRLLEEEKLMLLFSPALAGAKLNLPTFQKLHKARLMVPFGADFAANNMGLFLNVLLEKLNAKERNSFIKTLGLKKSDVTQWQKIDASAKKLERELKSAKLNRASVVYRTMKTCPGELMLYLMLRSQQRLVVDRIKNYFTKYIPIALEVTDRDVIATGIEPGPKFAKAKEDYINGRLDGRIKKPVPPEPPPAPPQATGGFARRSPAAAT